MLYRFALLLMGICAYIPAPAQLLPRPQFNGMYFQWGYNREIYTRSNIRFYNGDAYDFTIHGVQGHDKPDF